MKCRSVSGNRASGATSSDRRKIVVLGANCAGVSDTGPSRAQNEDALLLGNNGRLLAVADGMGGQPAGEVASALAIKAIRHSRLDGQLDDVCTAIENAFLAAQTSIRDHTRDHADCRGMATTLAVAAICGNQLHLGHIGDVRVYHLHDGTLRRLTNDHTPVGQLLRAKIIDEDSARLHPARNSILEAVCDNKRPAMPDTLSIDLVEGDTLLVCSDGVWGELADARIADLLDAHQPALNAAHHIVDEAIAAGGEDNATAIVYRHWRRRFDCA